MSGSERTIWITSTRDPDRDPVCELTWGPHTWYAPVAAVRQTAMDLVTCAAYADMMREMVEGAGIPVDTVGMFTTALLRNSGRTAFGHADTIDLIPAGAVHKATSTRQAIVLLARDDTDGMVTADEARDMAGDWLAAAEATESDQLVAEAFRATQKGNDAGLGRLFGYLRKLRDRN